MRALVDSNEKACLQPRPDLCFPLYSVRISSHQTLQFLPLCLVLSRFSSSRVSSESKLCVCFQSFVFFLSASLFSLAGCVRESQCELVCVCVCLQTNVCRLCFSFEHPFDVAVYLFISLPAKALSRRLGLQRIGRALLWVPSISEEPLWRVNRWPRLPIAHQLEAGAALGDFLFLFLRRRGVTRRACASSPPRLAEHRCASHVKQLFHLWPGGTALLWFPNDNGALVVDVLFYGWFDTCVFSAHYVGFNTVLLWLRPVWRTLSNLPKPDGPTQTRTEQNALS